MKAAETAGFRRREKETAVAVGVMLVDVSRWRRQPAVIA